MFDAFTCRIYIRICPEGTSASLCVVGVKGQTCKHCNGARSAKLVRCAIVMFGIGSETMANDPKTGGHGQEKQLMVASDICVRACVLFLIGLFCLSGSFALFDAPTSSSCARVNMSFVFIVWPGFGYQQVASRSCCVLRVILQ